MTIKLKELLNQKWMHYIRGNLSIYLFILKMLDSFNLNWTELYNRMMFIYTTWFTQVGPVPGFVDPGETDH